MTLSGQVLSISKGGDSTASLGSMFLCLATLTKKFSPPSPMFCFFFSPIRYLNNEHHVVLSQLSMELMFFPTVKFTGEVFSAPEEMVVALLGENCCADKLCRFSFP